MDSSGPMNVLAERLLKGQHAEIRFTFNIVIGESNVFFFNAEQAMKKELNLTSNKSISDSSSPSPLR